MGCSTDPNSWFCPRPLIGGSSTTTTTTTTGPTSFKYFKLNTAFCCIKGPTDSASPSTGSFSRRLRSSLTLSPSPEIVRHWIEAEPNDPLLLSQERFTVVSYNILAEKNASKHRDMYPNVPSVYMKWSHRKRVLCEELIGWNPDIICLQEVDKYYDILSTMEKAGYLGSYKRRTGDTVDGCAMLWKADKFRLLDGESIEFKQYGLRDNVAQLSVFEMRKAESRRLVVGNIHVLYNPNRGDVKLGQIRFLSSRAHMLSEKWSNIPVVLAGDYNSTPQSAIYEFMSSSELNIMLHDRRDLSGQRSCHPKQVLGLKKEKGSSPLAMMDRFFKHCWTDEEVKVACGSPDSQVAVHPLKLNSSYATLKASSLTRCCNGEPLATSYHSKFLGTVDYLWYSKGLVPTRVLDTVPIDILEKTRGLPCKNLGSDHLALVSEFAFIQSTKEDNKNITETSTIAKLPYQ